MGTENVFTNLVMKIKQVVDVEIKCKRRIGTGKAKQKVVRHYEADNSGWGLTKRFEHPGCFRTSIREAKTPNSNNLSSFEMSSFVDSVSPTITQWTE